MAETTLFVDTGAWYALADKSDGFHTKAVQVYPDLLRRYRYLTTTNLVVAETYTLMLRSLGHDRARKFLHNLGASPRIVKIYSDKVLEQQAEKILEEYEDQNFSYTDAVSFAVMNKYGIRLAFAFDQHFATAGFTLVP